jgi:hypothetical protein
MDSTTMTIDAMHDSRVRSVCPQVGRVLLAGPRDAVKGSSVPAFGGAAIATPSTDVSFQHFGEPPV